MANRLTAKTVAELAKELKERKLQAIDSVKPDCVATGNIGCMNQL